MRPAEATLKRLWSSTQGQVPPVRKQLVLDCNPQVGVLVRLVHGTLQLDSRGKAFKKKLFSKPDSSVVVLGTV